MTFSYGARLLSLCFASFFVVQLLTGLLVSAVAPGAVRWAERMNGQRAALFLFVLRLMPLVCGACVVTGLVVPSYLWLEPAGIREPVNLVCVLAAALGVAACSASIWRGVRAMRASAAYVKHCRLLGREIELPSDAGRALVVERAPGIALAGIFRPQLVISAAALRMLTGEQMAAVVRHERAHQHAGDNWKRLFMILAPRMGFWARGYEALERAWARFAEWAADDRAAWGSVEESVVLAEALVRVARVSTGMHPALVNSFVAEPADVAMRVERLLGFAACQEQFALRISMKMVAAGASLLTVAAITIEHLNLATVHLLLERLMH